MKSNIIGNEEQRLCGCSSCIGYVVAITRSQKLPSLLAQVAVVFFAAILLMGFLDDYGHRVLANVEGDAHRPSPPFGDVEQPPSLCHSSSRPLRSKAIVHDRHSTVKDGECIFSSTPVRLRALVRAQCGRGRFSSPSLSAVAFPCVSTCTATLAYNLTGIIIP